MLDSAVNSVKTLENSRKLSYISLGVVCLSFITSGFVKKSDVYYYDKETEQVTMEAYTQIQPVRSLETISTNASSAIKEIMNFNSSNYDQVLDEATDKWFTTEGANDFLTEMLINGGDQSIINRVVNGRLTLQAYPINATVLQSRIINGQYQWNIGVEIMLTMRNSFGYGSTSFIDASIWIVERDSSIYPQGIGIDSISFI